MRRQSLRDLHGDLLVDNAGDKYTIAQESFSKTYEFISPGV